MDMHSNASYGPLGIFSVMGYPEMLLCADVSPFRGDDAILWEVEISRIGSFFTLHLRPIATKNHKMESILSWRRQMLYALAHIMFLME